MGGCWHHRIWSQIRATLVCLPLHIPEPTLVYPDVVPTWRLMPEMLVIASPDQTLVMRPGDNCAGLSLWVQNNWVIGVILWQASLLPCPLTNGPIVSAERLMPRSTVTQNLIFGSNASHIYSLQEARGQPSDIPGWEPCPSHHDPTYSRWKMIGSEILSWENSRLGSCAGSQP